jgi:hypothetical protein
MPVCAISATCWRNTVASYGYNAGPAAVDKYGTIPPYRETIQYINRIDREMQKNN